MDFRIARRTAPGARNNWLRPGRGTLDQMSGRNEKQPARLACVMVHAGKHSDAGSRVNGVSSTERRRIYVGPPISRARIPVFARG